MSSAIKRLKPSSLWSKCLLASLFVHASAIYFLIENPIFLQKPWGSLFSSTSPTPQLIEGDKDWAQDSLIIEHFFEEFPSPYKAHAPTQILSSLSKDLPLKEALEQVCPLCKVPQPLLQDRGSDTLKGLQKNGSLSFVKMEGEEEKSLALANSSISSLPKVSLPPPSPPALDPFLLHEMALPIWTNDFVKDVNLSPTPVSQKPAFELTPQFHELLLSDKNLSLSSPSEPSFTALQDPSLDILTNQTPIEIPSGIFLDNLASIQSTDINEFLPENLIAALEWENLFDVKASIFPETGGYVFSLTIAPKKDLSMQQMKQNFYFLIDASQEIEKHKLSVFKKSALKALSTLKQGDTFNILLLGKKIIKLSPDNLFFSPQNLQLAERFLEKEGVQRPLFSSLNLGSALNSILASIETEDEVHSAILLTNGKSSFTPKDLQKFLETNRGRLNLFTAASGQNNNLTQLDMISTFSGGKLLYSDTNASFPRKLSVFMKKLQTPIAKNLTHSIYAIQPGAQIEVSTFAGQTPNIYNEEPLIIMGKLDRLCDLHLVLQGQSSEDQIFLKKVIHFDEATTPPSSVKKEWLLHQKVEHYQKFLRDEKPTHLNNAKDLLKSVHGRAFGE